jgi:hypothetical protein
MIFSYSPVMLPYRFQGIEEQKMEKTIVKFRARYDEKIHFFH